ncbi:hypothetical protein NQ318_013177 [Aromia moschata]|uniref:Uncharacterized protein n=1 Tax=Aromia moschata TaxID=1265417 RepID=A0AAV8Y4P4_9CUCU|nr:hypothetical protein NQ318_013177 [Aromia moschata]
MVNLEIRSDEGSSLTEPEKKELNTMLQGYKDVFEPSTEATPFAEHCIILTDDVPFAPKRDGPYTVHRVVTPTTFEISSSDNPNVPLGKYHISALTPYCGDKDETPLKPIRRRGRPPKKGQPNVPDAPPVVPQKVYDLRTSPTSSRVASRTGRTRDPKGEISSLHAKTGKGAHCSYLLRGPRCSCTATEEAVAAGFLRLRRSSFWKTTETISGHRIIAPGVVASNPIFRWERMG